MTRNLLAVLLDSGPVIVLAAIAGAGSFTHIRDTATEHGQNGWMAWAVAVCVDLTCVMAARERQRDKKTGRVRDGLASWPTLVLILGIVLSLSANLHQAEASAWGWITAATPAGAFLIAVSMLERRASGPRLEPSPTPSSEPVPVPALVPAAQDDKDDQDEAADGPSSELVDYARRVAAEYQNAQGKPISRDTLRARLGVSNQLASDLLRTLRTTSEAAR
ncbi:DUF2637 domain-containing protein [Streptosporangium sp. NPDC023963]|uniref:DUF2637 domain-containing protein n=1 Tax=Streptosporangium sp. NPDC023963 TaxID=3155608 RepID=UPI0034463B1F